MNNCAHLKRESIFYPLFEHGMIPIRNIMIPSRGELIGEGVQEFYEVDVPKLSDHQRKEISRIVARQCGGSPEEVEMDMIQRGIIPLRMVHVSSVSTNLAWFI